MTTTSAPTPASSASTLPKGPSSASRQADNAANPFQQMLSEEIRGKMQSAGKADERNADASPANNAAAPSDKTASSSDKPVATDGEQAGKEETSTTEIPMLSPELAAMIANLLQRQSANPEAAPAEEGDAVDADPLALLGKNGTRPGTSELQAKDKGMQNDADPRLALATDRASQAGTQSGNSSKPDLDLQALASAKPTTVDTGAKDTQSSEFNTVLQQLTPASQAAARSAQATPQAHLAPRVGTQGWDQALGQRMVWMANGAEQSASLTLNPPELGPLQVTLNVSNSQATASFLAPHADVRQALEAALPKLREMLGEVGIQLDQASVGQGSAQQQSEFARSGSDGDSSAGSRGTSEPAPVETSVVSRRISSGNGLVDTFA